jgi:O-acetyl-ADP-ribose deacetylase (regulator of RNase III)
LTNTINNGIIYYEVIIMIKIVSGDLLSATENLICHQTNCQGKMGSGVALQVKKKYPEAFDSYIELVNEYMIGGDHRSNLLGRVQSVKVDNKKWIINLFGQDKYGYDGNVYTDTNALFECFKQVRNVAESLQLSVAMPYMIGCYRGGADWKLVEDLLLTAFDGYEVTLYKLHRG